MSRLAGKVVVLTGASSGIGEQFARALDVAGASVVLAARRRERLDELASTLERAHVVQCDVAEPPDRADLIAAAVDTFGRIDGLVNNAGITNVAPALRETDDDFRRVLEVNLIAPFALSRDVARVMRENPEGGSIVNIASINSLVALPTTPEAGYAASKAGLAGLTRELAAQWARYKIRVNAIGPGAFVSEMTGNHFVEGPIAEMLKMRIPLGRPGRAGELDGLLTLLLSDEASYLTGQLIAVDGGHTIT